jgi:anaerobic selenocysteine-containing dehydrogenase
MSRRNFLKTSALGATAIVAGSGRARVEADRIKRFWA